MLKNIETHCETDKLPFIKNRAKIAVKIGVVAMIKELLIGLAVVN